MRLGGPTFGDCSDPDRWIAALRERGYSAAYCPVKEGTDPNQVRAFAGAASKAGIVIAEVGAWSNPMSPDEPTRRAALDKCRNALALS